MKKTLLLIVLLVFFNSYGQQSKIDSLTLQLELKKTNEEKIKILELLSKILINYSTPDKSIPYFLEMSAISKKLKRHELESQSYKYISECYLKKGDFENAEKYALEAIHISINSNDTNFYLIDINQLGRVYHHFQKYKKAVETYNKGISRYKIHPQGNAICTIYSNLGISYGQQGKIEKEINSYLKSSKYADKLESYTAKSFALYNIAYLYMDLNQYEKSEKYYLLALKDSTKIELKAYVYMNHHGLGNNYSRWGKYQKALKHNKIAYNYYKSTGNKLYQFDLLNNTAIVYGRMNNPSKSIKYANLALKLAVELNHKLAIAGAKQTLANGLINLKKYNEAKGILLEIARDTTDVKIISLETKSAIYQNLSSVYEGEKNYTKSLEYFKKFKNANDSILINQRDSNISDIETKYQTEKKEKENLQLKTEKVEQALLLEKETKQKWLLSFGLISSLLILVIGGYFYQKNIKQKEVIETLQKDLHHRVKNNLAIINRFIDVVKEEFNNEAFDAKLIELQNRIASINEVHQQLYNNKDATKLGVKKYIEKLKQNIENTYVNKNITVEQHIDATVNLKANISFPIGLIVNEFLTNSFKYAFTNTEKGKISININEADNHYKLELADNGKGFPKGFDISNSKTFGLRIMKLLTQQINGTFKIDGANGVKLTIQFPK
ncbi:tetratricopeptide repeat-containing sensor histidine kinase [Lutibacter sp.]